jgi:carnosine N-methyltransferase
MVELSQFAIQTYNFLLNRTAHAHQYTIYPWATDWQHQRSVEDMIAPITVPDVLPNAPNVRLIEGDFTQSLLDPVYDQKYDAVVTLYFIDTARNFLDYCETIQRVLKPGGLWLNLGRECSIISAFVGAPNVNNAHLL